jgi:hypothetical protein
VLIHPDQISAKFSSWFLALVAVAEVRLIGVEEHAAAVHAAPPVGRAHVCD